MDLREIVVAVREAVEELNLARTQLLQLSHIDVAGGRPDDQPDSLVAGKKPLKSHRAIRFIYHRQGRKNDRNGCSKRN